MIRWTLLPTVPSPRGRRGSSSSESEMQSPVASHKVTPQSAITNVPGQSRAPIPSSRDQRLGRPAIGNAQDPTDPAQAALHTNTSDSSEAEARDRFQTEDSTRDRYDSLSMFRSPVFFAPPSPDIQERSTLRAHRSSKPPSSRAPPSQSPPAPRGSNAAGGGPNWDTGFNRSRDSSVPPIKPARLPPLTRAGTVLLNVEPVADSGSPATFGRKRTR